MSHEKPKCQRCRHWHKLTSAIGECRVRSPLTTISLQSEDATISNKGAWAKTFAAEWCSEFLETQPATN